MLLELTLILLTAALAWHMSSRRPKNYPPTLPTSLPLFGQLHYLIWYGLGLPQDKIYDKLFQKYQKDGLLAIEVGQFRLLLVGKLEALKQAFQSEDTNYRYNGEMMKNLIGMIRGSSYTGSEGIIDNYGTKWQEQRRFMLRTLRDFGFGKSSMEDVIAEELSHVRKELDRYCGNKPVAAQDLFSISFLNVLWTTVSGQRYNYDDPILRDMVQTVKDVMQNGRVKPSLALLFPSLRDIYPEIDTIAVNAERSKTIRAFLQKSIEEHKTTFDPSNLRDYIDCFLLAVKEAKDPSSSFHESKADAQLTQSLFDLFFAGIETTASTLTWVTLFLVRNPDIQAKVREEIHRVIGMERQPQLSDRPSMPYTDAVIMESQRHGNVIPRFLNRATYEGEARIGNYVIPRGFSIQGLGTGIFHDEAVWPQAQEFRPERFLTQDGTKILKHDNFVPFSVGKRTCPGETMAKAGLFMFVTSLFQRYEIMPEDPQKMPSTEYVSGMGQAPVPFKVRMRLAENAVE